MSAPTVSTELITGGIGALNGTIGGNVTSDGGQTITARGIVYSAFNSTPTVGGGSTTNVTASGTTGAFAVPVDNLSAASYYFRAYATNAAGTSYGTVLLVVCETDISADNLANFDSETAVADVSSAVVSVRPLNTGGSATSNITARGILLSLASVNNTPTVGGSGVTTVTIAGTFGDLMSHSFTGLIPGVTYVARGYMSITNRAHAHSELIYFTPMLPPYQQKIIYSKPGPWSAVPEVAVLAKPIIEAGPNGWDSMREKLLVPFSPYFECGERREHMLDPRTAPFARMLMQEERVVGYHGPWPIVEVTSLGFAREKPWIIQTTQDTQGTVGGGALYRNLPTVTVTWFSETLVDTKSIIPGASVPPETFGWDALSLVSGGGNPQGWVIVKRDVDPLPVITGSRPEVTIDAGNVIRTSANLHPRPTLCKVVDYYVYDFIDLLPPGD